MYSSAPPSNDPEGLCVERTLPGSRERIHRKLHSDLKRSEARGGKMLGVHLLTPRDPVQLIVTLEVQMLFSRPVFYLPRNSEKSVPASHLPKGLKRS